MKKRGIVRLDELIKGVQEGHEEFINPTPESVHVPTGSRKKKPEQDKQTYSIDAMGIFKIGVHHGEAFTIQDLDEIVNNTNVLLKTGLVKIPVKLGHSEDQALLQNDGYPAGGYVQRVFRMGDQIFADITDIPKDLYELIKAKAYDNVSSEIYMEYEHPTTKEDMGKVLRAVSLLGADIPEVKGLADMLARYKSREPAYAYATFAEKDLMEVELMKKTFTLEEVKQYRPCCVEQVKKYMEENKLKEIDGEKLAEIVTLVGMKKFDDVPPPPPVERKCPPGHKWDETAQKCITTNADDKSKPEEQKICAEGMVWDETQNKCVDAPVADNKAGGAGVPAAGGPPVPKKAVDMLKEIMVACGFTVDDAKDILAQFPTPSDFFEKVGEVVDRANEQMLAEKLLSTEQAKTYAEGIVRLYADIPAVISPADKEPTAWDEKEIADMKTKQESDTTSQVPENYLGFPEDKRPPKGWWDKCIAAVQGKTDTPEKLCGHIYQTMSPEAKAKAEATRAAAEPEKVKELKERVRKLMKEQFTEKIKKIREDNRGVFIPALDGYFDAFSDIFTADDDPKIIKFKENGKDVDVRVPELFMKFMNDLAKAKTVIFGEIARVDRETEEKAKSKASKEDKEKLIKKLSEVAGGKELRGADEAADALKLSKELHVSYRDAAKKIRDEKKKDGE